MKECCNFFTTIFYILKYRNIQCEKKDPLNFYAIVEFFDDARLSNVFIEQIRHHTMLSTLRLLTLYMQVKNCEKNCIKGDFVECGVWKGGAVGLMALTNQKFGRQRRHLHLFDVFDDICAPDSVKDGQQAIEDVFHYTGIKNMETLRNIPKNKPLKGFYDQLGGKGTLAENKTLFFSQLKYDKTYVHFYKGWFKNTMPAASKHIQTIAILRIDADWYDSVYICLHYLYPKVVKGGYIIIDDYGYYEGCTKAVKDYFAKHHIRKRIINIDSGCAYVMK